MGWNFSLQFYQGSDTLSRIQRPPPASGRKDKESRVRVFSVQMSQTFFKAKKWDFFLKEINGFMLNVTDQYCISPPTNKVGFSCHSGDLSRKCHSSHGSCKSGKGGTRPPSLRYKTVRNTRSLLWSVAGVPSPLLRYCSCVSGFPSFICFNLINGHSCDQNIP